MKIYGFQIILVGFVRSLLLIIVLNLQLVIGVKHALFSSISQLELLWQNDIDTVKIMENLLEESVLEYKPLKKGRQARNPHSHSLLFE